MTAKKTITGRRKFLAALGAGGAAATVALTAKNDDPVREKPTDARPAGGYRLTEHVRNYYRTTKV